MRSVALGFLLAFSFTSAAVACSVITLNPEDLIENTPAYSSDGRFCVIVRRYPVPDFTSAPAATVFPDDDSDLDTPVRSSFPTALYEIVPGGRRLVGQFAIDIDTAGKIVVANSGRFFVAIRMPGIGCSRISDDSPLFTIHRADGVRIATLKVVDAFTPGDLDRLLQRYWAPVTFAIRRESDDREVLVLSIRAPDTREQDKIVERRIDLATGVLLDPRLPIAPTPRVYITPVAATDPIRRFEAGAPDCSAFEAKDLVRVPSDDLFAHATAGPLPEFPALVIKTRIRTDITVEVVVSDRGEVTCVRGSAFPFGLTAVATDTARRWKFKRFSIGGHIVPVIGTLLVHFADVDDDAWREIVRNSPPQD